MPERRDDDNMPPIPDGGLAESMPEWLRRPPAWRTLQDDDVVQTRPAEPEDLPEADTSEIDPRTFLTDDDLPAWLRNLGHAHRAEGGRQEQQPESPAAETAPAGTATRFVPRHPPIRSADRTAGGPARPAPRPQPSPAAPWWQGAAMVALLGVLLLIAIIVIVVLAVG